MLTLAEAKVALDVGGAAIALFDKLYPRIWRALTGKEPKTSGSIRVERRGEELVATKDGKSQMQVTYQDLMQRLSPEDVNHIRMYEQSIKNYEAQIEKIYPQLALLPPVQKAQVEVQLKQMVDAMQSDLLGILSFIERIGLDLEDHYSRVYDLIDRGQTL